MFVIDGWTNMYFLQVTAGERVEDSREENARGEG